MPTDPQWFCGHCNALRSACVRWGAGAILNAWAPLGGAALCLALGARHAALLLAAYWPIALVLSAWLGTRRECAACGHPHLISARQKLADLEAIQARRTPP